MLIIKGVLKGTESKPWAMGDKNGVANKAFIEGDDVNLSPIENIQAVKLETGYVPVAKVGSMVEWVVKINGYGKLVLVSENIKK